MVLAVKNRGAAVRLERQREKGQLFKNYLAIAEGLPEPGEGKIDKPLGAVPGERNRMRITQEGKKAITQKRPDGLPSYPRPSFPPDAP